MRVQVPATRLVDLTSLLTFDSIEYKELMTTIRKESRGISRITQLANSLETFTVITIQGRISPIIVRLVADIHLYEVTGARTTHSPKL